MPLPCLTFVNGLLLPTGPAWQTGNQTVNTPNGTQVVSTVGGGFPGIAVTKGGSTEFFTKPPSGNLHFMVFGGPPAAAANFVAILTISDLSGPANRTVVFVDTTGATPVAGSPAMFVSANSTQSLPAVYANLGDGSVCFLWGPISSGSVVAGVHRSDTGASLCSALPWTPTGQVGGEITATQLLVKHGGTTVMACPRPAGLSTVTPDPLNFPDAVIGAGVPPALTTSVRTPTIRNDGTNCLTVTAIGNIAPYSVTATSMTLPAILAPAATMTVDVTFAPTAIGTFNVDLPLTLTPAAGDVVIRCRGEARSPMLALSLSGSLSFGSVPVGATSTRTLTITNTGEATVNVAVAANASGDLTWPAVNSSVNPMASTSVLVTFSPTSEGSQNRNVSVTSTPGSTYTATATGTGCIARAQIAVTTPPGPVVDFGQVERGFRMVKVFAVQNAGNGPLSFRASVTGSTLFGIQLSGGSVTSPLATQTFSVPPVTACGSSPTGSGLVEFGVVFFADLAPGLATAQLVIDNHNAPTGPASLTLDLQATVVAQVNVDTELVLDRSGSMSETSGSRSKIATAIDAARLFVQLGRPDVDDRLGLVRFNTTPNVFSSITAVTNANQPALIAAINTTQLSPTGATAIAGGVIEAERDINANPRPTIPPGLRRAIVVLTDGKDNTPYTNPSDGVTYTLMGEGGTTPLPNPPGIRVYALGIGDNIDIGRLGQLAQATGGEFLQVRELSGVDFFGLEKYFTQIYMDTVDLATIREPVYTIAAGDRHVIEFDILRGDVATMVVVYDRDGVRIPFWLETSQGETITLGTVPPGYQLRPGISNTARFLEVRLPVADPTRYAGTWKLVVQHDGRACYVTSRDTIGTHAPAAQPPIRLEEKDYGFGFQPTYCRPYGDPITYGFAIGVGSNFRLMPYVFPGIVKVGEPIQLNAEVNECGLPITGCVVTVSSLAPDGVVRNFTLHDDAAHGDGAADDGDYGHRFTHTAVEGTYRFTFRATGYSRDGEAVEREAVRSKYVEGRVPLVPPDGRGQDECCKKSQRWLQVLGVILLLILIVLVLIWLA